MLPHATSIWQRDSQPNASGRPGAVHIVAVNGFTARIGTNIIGGIHGGNAAKQFEMIAADSHISIEGQFNATLDVKFGKGTPFQNDPVIPTLTQIAGVVTHTLDQFEALIRNSS